MVERIGRVRGMAEGISEGPSLPNIVESFPELKAWNRRWPLYLIGIVVFLSFFVNLGNAPLFDRDEGAFSEATREMVESGNYISTTLNHINISYTIML